MTSTDGQLPRGASSFGDPADGPLSVELLADLHADALDEQVAARLRLRVAADDRARLVLAALDATVADLAALPAQRTPPIPEDVVARLDSALAAEAQQECPTPNPARPVPDSHDRDTADIHDPSAISGISGTPGISGIPGITGISDIPGIPGASGLPSGQPPAGTAPSVFHAPAASLTDLAARRSRRAGWAGAGVLAAAAAAIGVAALAGVQLETAGTPRAADALGAASGVQPPGPLALTHQDLGSALKEARGTRDFGPLSSPAQRRGCLAANGVASGIEPSGALEVTVDGRRGVLMVLPTGRIAEFRLLVVGPDCGPANPAQIADDVIGDR